MLQEIVVEAFGVEVAIVAVVKVPKAVDVLSVLQETLEATVALTVTVLEETAPYDTSQIIAKIVSKLPTK